MSDFKIAEYNLIKACKIGLITFPEYLAAYRKLCGL